MPQRKNQNKAPVKILLLAKQSGQTSFSSLTAVKKALGTTKVGHTGTLDSFADGLLVVLSGKLTHLVPHITAFDKEYLALVQFGTETDTLDPTGNVVDTGAYPSEETLRSVLPRFIGQIEQVPPAFSAIHVGGKRASDILRSGKNVEIPARKITVYDIQIKEFSGKYALLKIVCSKGTYIRALARDIALACGTVAHLAALRRTRVGSFLLNDAAGVSELPPFTIESLTSAKMEFDKESRFTSEFLSEIVRTSKDFTPEVASLCGLDVASLAPDCIEDFVHGRPLKKSALSLLDKSGETEKEIAVYYPEGDFAGLVRRSGSRYSYGFVVERDKKAFDFTIYSWDQILNGKFSAEWKNKGTALSIGSFDGPHLGHKKIFSKCLEKSNLIPGIVTFTRPLSALKHPDEYPGDITTLSSRLEYFKALGFAFVLLIDFSGDFCKTEGSEFLKVLIEKMGLTFLSEGFDFHCGYQGAFTVPLIREFCDARHVEFSVTEPILYQNERIASRRIREEIQKGMLGRVFDMLGHPFEIDCSGLSWSEQRENNWISARVGENQILPPDGEYPVKIKLSAESSETSAAGQFAFAHTFKTACKLENGNLRLPLSDGSLPGLVRTIEFCNQSGIK